MARLAIALRLFAGYCDQRGLKHDELTDYTEHLWDFIALPDSCEAFREWVDAQPPLVDAGLGDEYPIGFERLLVSGGVPDSEFRYALCCATDVLYGSLYGACDEAGSRRLVGELANLVRLFGVELRDTSAFSSSRWSDRHGWGERPTPNQIGVWRMLPVT